MSKKMNNKVLGIVLLILVVIFVLTKLIKVPHEQSSLKTDLVTADTSEVSKIVISKGIQDQNPVVFKRKGNDWTVSQGDITDDAETGSAGSIMAQLEEIRPKRLVATSKDKWKEYELNDSLATEISLMNSAGKKLGEILIGKFTYSQPSNPYGGYGRGSVSGTSYVRLPDEKEVYAVDGFLSMMFKRDFNAWRDKTFIETGKNDIQQVSFTYPADSSFTLSFRDSVWYAGGVPADSAKTAGYLNQISRASGSSFKDHYIPDGSPAFMLTITGNNMQPVTVEGYHSGQSAEYILHSSQNPDAYFSSDGKGLFNRLFKGKDYFVNPS